MMCMLKMFAVLRFTMSSICINLLTTVYPANYDPYLKTTHGRNENVYAMYANMPVYILAQGVFCPEEVGKKH